MATLIESCRGLPERRLAAGECLIEEGQHTGRLFILAEGVVEVLKSDILVAVVDERGAFFGEMALLLGTPHTATVRAATPCRFHVVEDTRTFLGSPDVQLAMSRLLAKRLQMVTTYLADLQQQFAEQADHLGMVDEVLESLLQHQEERD